MIQLGAPSQRVAVLQPVTGSDHADAGGLVGECPSGGPGLPRSVIWGEATAQRALLAAMVAWPGVVRTLSAESENPNVCACQKLNLVVQVQDRQPR